MRHAQNRPNYHLTNRAEVPNRDHPSWWTDAPRDGLTALAESQIPRMGLSRFSRLTVLALGPLRPGTIEEYRAKKAFATRARI